MTVTESKLKEGALVFGPADTPLLTVSCQATEVSLEPSFSDAGEAVEVLCGDDLAPSSKTSWVLKFTGIQDWENKEGFINFAFDHDGEVVPFKFTPKKGGVAFTQDVTVKALTIGGAVNTRLTSSAEWPCAGKPQRVEPPPTGSAPAPSSGPAKG
ncbi:hypothetical protein [Yinghuangia soli]|uniref:Uncharacterized protein n=1 Tax=Yinghuangia soli TaxID=2908204 RepID=A0AA41Q0L7_9ACTN|nr:hypothetical protein [Yinghuangia soli]MCF2529373.1 hypothetical protein [Yinghuangia soli]